MDVSPAVTAKLKESGAAPKKENKLGVALQAVASFNLKDLFPGKNNSSDLTSAPVPSSLSR